MKNLNHVWAEKPKESSGIYLNGNMLYLGCRLKINYIAISKLVWRDQNGQRAILRRNDG